MFFTAAVRQGRSAISEFFEWRLRGEMGSGCVRSYWVHTVILALSAETRRVRWGHRKGSMRWHTL